MKRYSSFNAFESVIEDYDDSKINGCFDVSVTDDSFFVPESELIKRLRNGVTYGQALQGAYDFVDGKDTGINVPIDRHKGIDIAEVTEYAREVENNAKEKLQKEKLAQTNKEPKTTENPVVENPVVENNPTKTE